MPTSLFIRASTLFDVHNDEIIRSAAIGFIDLLRILYLPDFFKRILIAFSNARLNSSGRLIIKK
jgi:hypothetical protein